MSVPSRDASTPVELVPVRDVRMEVRLPTPPVLELVFYTGALVTGVLLGAVATIVTHAVG